RQDAAQQLRAFVSQPQYVFIERAIQSDQVLDLLRLQVITARGGLPFLLHVRGQIGDLAAWQRRLLRSAWVQAADAQLALRVIHHVFGQLAIGGQFAANDRD